MVNFVGAGPGAVDLITVRGLRLIKEADQIIYAGSLVNRELLSDKKEACIVLNSAGMTLEQVIKAIVEAEAKGLNTVRLHTGDPSIYGAVREQMDELDKRGIAYASCPGVSSFCGAASALNMEYTLPGISQSVIITRMEGRTPVPEKETIKAFAAHQSTMVLFLSAGMTGKLSEELVKGGYGADTPAAVVYKATWPGERKLFCTIGTLEAEMRKAGITKTALILVGNAVAQGGYERSKLYDPAFTTEFRKGTGKEE